MSSFITRRHLEVHESWNFKCKCAKNNSWLKQSSKKGWRTVCVYIKDKEGEKGREKDGKEERTQGSNRQTNIHKHTIHFYYTYALASCYGTVSIRSALLGTVPVSPQMLLRRKYSYFTGNLGSRSIMFASELYIYSLPCRLVATVGYYFTASKLTMRFKCCKLPFNKNSICISFLHFLRYCIS
jgi:hypothetical protein